MARRNLVSGLVGVLVLFAITLTLTEGVIPPGGVTKLSGTRLEAAVKILKDTLAKLAAGEGPTYSVSKVSWATYQVTSGEVYTYGVNLKGSDAKIKKCNVQIWTRTWLENGTQITITCNGETAVVRKLN